MSKHGHSHDCGHDHSNGHTHEHAAANGEADEEIEGDEIYIEVTEDGYVILQSGEWELPLDPGEARALAQALNDAAGEAESSYAEAG